MLALCDRDHQVCDRNCCIWPWEVYIKDNLKEWKFIFDVDVNNGRVAPAYIWTNL